MLAAAKRLVTDCGKYIKQGIESTQKGFRGEYVIRTDELLLYDFKDPRSINNFICISDADIGGKSTAHLNTSKYGRLLFHGNASIDIDDNAVIDHSGFCGIRSKPVVGLFKKVVLTDMEGFDCIEIKYRGDGRPYFLNIQTDSMLMLNKFDLYQAFIFTKGGPNWEVERIPFTKFLMTYKGYLQDSQLDFNNVRTIGVSLSDKKSGPYFLEIEYLKVVKVGHMPLMFRHQKINRRFQT